MKLLLINFKLSQQWIVPVGNEDKLTMTLIKMAEVAKSQKL